MHTVTFRCESFPLVACLEWMSGVYGHLQPVRRFTGRDEEDTWQTQEDVEGGPTLLLLCAAVLGPSPCIVAGRFTQSFVRCP
jgi:hypothetical protein